MFKFFKKRIPEVITLPGYETIIPNVVYSPAMEETALERNVLLLCRFKEPFIDEIINYIAQKAENFPDLAPILSRSERISLTKLEYWLYHFPVQNIDQLREHKLRDELRWAMPFSIDEENSYTRVLLGTMSSKDLQEGAVVENIPNPLNWYQRHMETNWEIYIAIREGKLLPRKELDFLIKHSTSNSRSLRVVPENYYNILLPAIAETVYEGLSCTEQMNKLTDVSSEILEEKAVTTLHRLYYFLMQRGDIEPMMKVAMKPSAKPPYFVKAKKGQPN